MRSAFRGPAHQLAVRMRINNFTHGHHYYGPSNQLLAANHACTSNCTCACAEGLHFKCLSVFFCVWFACVSGFALASLFPSAEERACTRSYILCRAVYHAASVLHCTSNMFSNYKCCHDSNQWVVGMYITFA